LPLRLGASVYTCARVAITLFTAALTLIHSLVAL
jgi:hypothetical protein